MKQLMLRPKPVLASVLVVMLLALASVVWADGRNQTVNTSSANVSVGAYRPWVNALAAYRTTLSAADTDAGIGTITSIFCAGYTTVSVSTHFSTATANASVAIIRYGKSGTTYSVETIGVTTAVAQNWLTGSTSKTIAPTLYFDTEGAEIVKIGLTGAPSAGNVDLFVRVN